MAIDTAAKRKSCVGVILFALRMGVIPTGSDLAAAERLHTNGLYSGIAASAPSTPTGQSPRASRYRFAYRMTDVVRMFILWL
jgi:hypothetical protein